MAKELPESMDDLVYFSRRSFAGKGSATVWANRQPCLSCKKGLMSKPLDKKTGRFKTRAKEYVCPECGHEEEKAEHEKRLTAEIVYTCPFCDHKDEVDAPYAKKSFYGKKAIIFVCSGCGEKLGITKKLSVPKKFLEKLE